MSGNSGIGLYFIALLFLQKFRHLSTKRFFDHLPQSPIFLQQLDFLCDCLLSAKPENLNDSKWPTCFVIFFQTLSKSIVLQSPPVFREFRHCARQISQRAEEKPRVKFHYSLFNAAKTIIFQIAFYVFASRKTITGNRFSLLFILRINIKTKLLCQLIYYIYNTIF